MLNNEQWQPIPGAPGAHIYPLIKKPSLVNSNSFIISTDENIILIDTGAEPGQLSQIKEVIGQLLAAQDRPVLILLTHCHGDHWLQAFDQELRETARVRVAIQEQGVRPLEKKDEIRTVADVMGMELPDAKIDFVLLSGQDIRDPGDKLVDLGEGILLETKVEVVNTGTEVPFFRQAIKIGSQDTAEVYPMPGHSPDGICIGIGNLLFLGDFFFALDYLVAGLSGWNREEMLASIKNMDWMAQNMDITMFCSGHGNPFSHSDAADKIIKMRAKVESMPEVSTLDQKHFSEASEYAVELLEELNDTMAVIAGRMYSLAYYLEYLEESAQAEKYSSFLDFDRIDDLLATYDDFAQRFAAGNVNDPVITKKAGQLIGKIKKTFALKDSDKVIDSLLFSRVERSLADFIRITGGMPLEEPAQRLDLNSLIRGLLEEINGAPYKDNIMEVLDSEEQYLEALVARIAFQPVFKNVQFNFSPGEDLPLVEIHKDRLCDALVGILEEIAAFDIKEIFLLSNLRGEDVTVAISVPGGIPADVLNEKKLKLYQRKFANSGGTMEVEKKGEGQAFILKLNC